MKISRIFTIAGMALLVVLLSLTGCHTKKKVVVADTNPSGRLVERVMAAEPHFRTAVASRARLVLNYQQREVSANATINIVTDSAIVVSVQPFLGVELVRIELSKQGVTLVDKLNRRYCSMTFEQITGKSNYRVTYHDIESLLTSRLFAVGHDSNWLRTTPLTIRQEGEVAYLSFSEQQLRHLFTIDNATARISATTLQLGSENQLITSYTNLQQFSDRLFPANVQLRLDSRRLSATCSVILQSVSFDTNVNVAPVNTAKYNKVDLSTIVPM